MGYGKEELGRLIGEMGEKLMERFSEEMGKLRLEIRQREREWREERRGMVVKIESLEKRVMELEARVGEGMREGGGTGEKGIGGHKGWDGGWGGEDEI